LVNALGRDFELISDLFDRAAFGVQFDYPFAAVDSNLLALCQCVGVHNMLDIMPTRSLFVKYLLVKTSIVL